MQSRRWFFVPVFLVCMIGSVVLWQRTHRLYYPTPATESAFLKTYTPERVIGAFREPESFASAHPSSGTAGETFVEHRGGFEFYIVLSRENWTPLMNALRDDALQQLSKNRAEVLGQSGDPHGGFRLEYKLDKSIGTLTILPLEITRPYLVHRKTPLCKHEDVTVKIDQTEQWFPKEVGTIQASVTSSVH